MAVRMRIAIVALAAVLAGVLGACDRLTDALVEREIERNLTRTDWALLDSPDLHVVLCGTGTPAPDPDRASACTAIIAGGELVVVDAGPGSWKALDRANLPGGRLSAIFLTHFHSDHIGGLGEAITQSWLFGRERPLDVYGPPGTARVVAGFTEAYAQDVDYRVAHHGEAYLPRAAAVAVAHEFTLEPESDPSAARVIFERSGLKVTMFRVDHGPVKPAVGYRFDYRGRAVVLSGDTKKSASVVAQARGADMLIHEAVHRDTIERAAAFADRSGQRRLGKMIRDITTYHTATTEAAEVARDAGVPRLVFSHVIPGPTNFLARRIFLAGVSDIFPGEVILGEDTMRFRLPARSPTPSKQGE